MNSYIVTGCEETQYNDIFDYKETTCNGSLWWRSRNKNLMLRYSPGYGWALGWYSAPDNNSEEPPPSGWKFNGGRCDPPNLGENIIIKQY
jgi:hypothetical protein